MNGSFGTVHFNILMLGIVHEGVAFPLFWTMLDKQGNSRSDEHIDLLESFERVFPDAKVRCLTGDREFVGKDWCSDLLLPKTHQRRAKSLFRYGGDFLRRTCCDLALRSAEFDQALQLLSLY
jgi:hypothetical protein